MTVRIAQTFNTALGKLRNKEQKQVKLTVFDFQTEQGRSGLRYHKIDKGRDPNFRSVSVNMDLRIIVHVKDDSVLLCYVDHHDKAYSWANRRKLEVHPKTGAAQLVEVVERVEQVAGEQFESAFAKTQPKPSKATGSPGPQADKKPLADYDNNWLLEYGVPEEWLARLKGATEDQLLDLAMHLPEEAQEIVLTIATGKVPDKPTLVLEAVDPFEHPDAQRRFRRIDSREEMEAALDAPFDAWRIFLHPSQGDLVAKDYTGPARVAGSAGTGKTVVALHRAAHLLRDGEQAMVLLTTFSQALANSLKQTFKKLIAHEPQLMERITIESLDEFAQRLFTIRNRGKKLVATDELKKLVLAKAEQLELNCSAEFVWREWKDVVDAWQVYDWESYRTIARVGRGHGLTEKKRAGLWAIFSQVLTDLKSKQQLTLNQAYNQLNNDFAKPTVDSPYTHFVVDEAQDISVAQLRLLVTLAKDRPAALFFSGDLGQRIFQAPFSWASLGSDVRGRSHTLRINYRTSHQIRLQADRLLDPEIADMDGNLERRDQAQSVFNGPPPSIEQATTEAEEASIVGDWIRGCIEDGMAPHEIAIFVRSERELSRGKLAIGAANANVCELDHRLQTKIECVTLSTMHLAKGLEFKAVAAMALDEDVIPNLDRLDELGGDIKEVYRTERHLLYVAATRARDRLLISCAGQPSEFIEDLLMVV